MVPTCGAGVFVQLPLRHITIIDGSTWPPAPVGVVGAEVVPEFVGHDIEVPAVVVQVVHHGWAQVRAESGGVRSIAVDAEVGNAACSGIRSSGQQVHNVARTAREIGVFEPFWPKRIKHGTGVAREGRVWIGGFPDVDVRSCEVNEVVQFRLVDFTHPGEQGEGPFNGSVAVSAKLVVGEVIDVQRNFNALQHNRITGQRAGQAHGLRCVHLLGQGFQSTFEYRCVQRIGGGIQDEQSGFTPSHSSPPNSYCTPWYQNGTSDLAI